MSQGPNIFQIDFLRREVLKWTWNLKSIIQLDQVWVLQLLSEEVLFNMIETQQFAIIDTTLNAYDYAAAVGSLEIGSNKKFCQQLHKQHRRQQSKSKSNRIGNRLNDDDFLSLLRSFDNNNVSTHNSNNNNNITNTNTNINTNTYTYNTNTYTYNINTNTNNNHDDPGISSNSNSVSNQDYDDNNDNDNDNDNNNNAADYQLKCFTYRAMDFAARKGHLDVVKFLHESRNEGMTMDAMDYAAQNGHLAIIKFLHFNRSEGCTKYCLDSAARSGRLEIVKFLDQNRKEGCTTFAMDQASNNGHLAIK
eukprot:Pgem_evm1s10932